eukprot:gene11793-biopygen3382
MPDTVQEWHAEEVIFEACWRMLQASWSPKLAKSGLKDAPQASKTSQKWLERRAAATRIHSLALSGSHRCYIRASKTLQKWLARRAAATSIHPLAPNGCIDAVH